MSDIVKIERLKDLIIEIREQAVLKYRLTIKKKSK